jgi:hypothetical protein
MNMRTYIFTAPYVLLIVCRTAMPHRLRRKVALTILAHWLSNGSSASSPFKIANFWAVAKAGSTLCCLMASHGSSSMINPPQNLSGTCIAPITVRALNDGKVTYQRPGQRANPCVCRTTIISSLKVLTRAAALPASSAFPIRLKIIREVAAGTRPTASTTFYGINSGKYTLLEDVRRLGHGAKNL